MRLRPFAAALFLLSLLPACTPGARPPLFEDLGLAGERAGLRYTVAITGATVEGELLARLYEASETARRIDQPPANELVLRRRARADVPRLEALLRAQGYFAGKVAVRIERPSPAPATSGETTGAQMLQPEFRVVFEVDPGPLYRLGQRLVEVVGQDYGFHPPGPADLGLVSDAPAQAERILGAEERLLAAARSAGHARAALGERELVVDHRTRRMDVRLRIVPGPVYEFGELRFSGGEGIARRFLEEVVAIRPGARFDPARIDQARRALLDTQLFSLVQVEVGEPQADNRLPVSVRLEMRRPRSVGGALGYTTDEGPRLRAFWEHRNIFGSAERLRLDTQLSRPLGELRLQLRKPHLFSRRQDLLVDGGLRVESTEGFESRSIRAGIGLERRLRPGTTGTLGVAWRFSEIREGGEERLFALLSLPGALRIDRSDSLLDPSRGWRLLLETAPFQDVRDAGRTFVRSRLSHSRYLSIWNEPRLVLALRGAIGTILGEERDRVPADERFYAGGGGSVRGIPFQKAGPLDAGRDPLGGRSLLEGSAELRLRPRDRWEIALFLDLGGAFTSVVPDLREDTLRLGTGFGLRYLTPIGPLRFDLGVPIEPRRDVDDPFQFYISLGQAF
ncbi:Translocation and assembly module TamA [bacterium HR40]|nr:Translocation and assembly module TamA [bacterium HR40]